MDFKANATLDTKLTRRDWRLRTDGQCSGPKTRRQFKTCPQGPETTLSAMEVVSGASITVVTGRLKRVAVVSPSKKAVTKIYENEKDV